MFSTTDTSDRQTRWTKLQTDLNQAKDELNKVLGPPSHTPIDLKQAMLTSQLALPNYSTVDDDLIVETQSRLKRISAYISDSGSHRPLSFMLTAEPGSGKSHFVKCLADDCGVPIVTANVASLETMSELGYWIEQIRDHKTQDKTPILLIDEADSKPNQLAAFLPLLWDGVFSWHGRSFKIGKCIIVLVASDENLRRYVEDGNESGVRARFPKVEDLLSRINGGVMKLGAIDDRLPDKLCIALIQIRRRFKGINGIQLPYLKLLVNTRFLHSSRSMETLVDYFPAPNDSGILEVTPEFEKTLGVFLKKESFRNNVFAFHLGQQERISAMTTWNEFRQLLTTVMF